MMANEHSSPILPQPSSDTSPRAHGPPTPCPTRQDTSSSTGSGKPIPKGKWTLNLSGNCPGCHHHHNSVEIHVKATSDSSHVGDVHCENCERLWLSLGKRSSTRFSLISTKSIKVDPLESTFRSTLIHMIRSATALVASSPALRSTTLTDISESSSAGPSRETSIRTVTRNGLTTTSSGMTPECKDLSSTPSQAWDTRTTFRSFVRHRTSVSNRRIPGTPQFILRVRQRIGAKFPALQSSLLGRWFSEEPKLSPKKEGKQPVRETLPSSTPPPVFTSNPVDVEHGTQTNIDDDSKQYNLQGCASSANREDALNTIKAMDQNAMRELTADQRIGWMREQITVFKTLSRPIPPTVTSATVDNGTQVDMDTVDILSVSQRPLVRRHSALPYIGNLFGSFEYWEVLRGSTSTLNGRRFSISDTHLSEADTVFEEASATSAPRNTLSESLRHERSPRPHSTHSIAQNWQQIMQYRMEARRSFDSTATVNVRSITSPRGRAPNRLSRTSARASSIYVTEPSVSQVQLAQSMNEEPGLPSDQERHIAPSESPPTP